MKIEIEYGVLSEPLATQLKDQGITINDFKTLEKLQSKANMINKLYLADILTERAANHANNRLHKQLISNLIPQKDEEDDNFRPRIS